MRRLLATLLVVPLVACDLMPRADEDAAAPESAPNPPFNVETLPQDSIVPERPATRLVARPATRLDTLLIEGEPQPDSLTLLQSPEGFAPPFSTYVPRGIDVEFGTSDSTPSVRFIAAFGGTRNPDAYLQLRLYPPGAAELVARNAVDVYLRGRDPRQDNVRASERWPWSIDTWDFSYGGQAGSTRYHGAVAIARHGNRYLHVLAHYPAEYGDGLPPRIERILREWRWEDDGSMLTATP